jgi:hypothetical protein
MRKCIECKKFKKLTEFYSWPRNPDCVCCADCARDFNQVKMPLFRQSVLRVVC